MKINNLLLFFAGIIMVGCGTKKNNNSTTTSPPKLSVNDSIETTIATYDRRLDIKMKRKTYEASKGVSVTFQKYFEYGDTTKLIKLRVETLTNDKQMDVLQYHFINNAVAEIHDYQYNKHCDNNKQCMSEDKYYFDKGKILFALRRTAEGTNENMPVIENAMFKPIFPTKDELKTLDEQLKKINDKYNKLPFQKPKS